MFMKINNSSDLHTSIAKLEQQKEFQKDLLTQQFHATCDSLKPINILKNSLNKVVHSPGTVENIINTTVSLGVGLLSKKLLIGKSSSIIKKILGTAMEFGVAGLISKQSNSIKLGGLNLLSKIFKSKKSPPQIQ